MLIWSGSREFKSIAKFVRLVIINVSINAIQEGITVQKGLCAALLLAIILLLSACEFSQSNDTLLPTPPTYQPENTGESEVLPTPEESAAESTPEPEELEDAVMETEPPQENEQVTEPTMPLHSELYLEDCSLQQITEYFEEVVLNVEYSDGTGDDHVVQKWRSPIYYRIDGSPTDTDINVLNALFEQLNAVDGFPGIYPAADDQAGNVSISFLDEDAFNESFSNIIQGEYAFGAVQFWYYTDFNELYSARIGYRTDIEQSVRNSVLIEEVINILGITDTVLRPDSITYQYSNEASELSDVDWVILKLLYNTSIRCGMDAQRCEEIIAELYY